MEDVEIIEDWKSSNPTVTIKSPKHVSPFIIKKAEEVGLWEVCHERGECGVKGFFISVNDAKREVLAYIKRSRVSTQKRTRDYAKYRRTKNVSGDFEASDQ